VVTKAFYNKYFSAFIVIDRPHSSMDGIGVSNGDGEKMIGR
jgi:hypothetical protein